MNHHSCDAEATDTMQAVQPSRSTHISGADAAAVKDFEFQRNVSNPEYWRRVGAVDFTGKTVLEIGCGLGALTVDIIQRGAARVVAIDLDEFRINFARAHLSAQFPEVFARTEFKVVDIAELEAGFDVVISKDTFEHVEDLHGMVRDIHRLLRPGGIMVAGFSPLYFSPFGDHGRLLGKNRLPWAPALIPEPALLRIASMRRRRKIRSISDLGLNKLTPKQFRAIMDPTRWETVSFDYNRRIGRLAKLFNAMRRIGILEKYFTVNIYAQYRRR